MTKSAKKIEWMKPLERFFHTGFYLALVASIVFVSYLMKWELYGAAVIVFIASLGFIVCSDLTPLIMPLLAFVFIAPRDHIPPTMSFFDFYLPYLWLIYTMVGVAVLALVLHFVIHGRVKGEKRGRLVWSFIPLAVALLLSGILSPVHVENMGTEEAFLADGYIINNLVFGAITALSWGGIYLLCVFNLRFDKKLVEYFCECCFFIALILIGELIYVYATVDLYASGYFDRELITFGWGIQNGYAGIVNMLIPATFYLTKRKGGFIYYVVAVLTFIALVFSTSRAGILVGTVTFIIGLIALCVYGEKSYFYRRVVFFTLALGVYAVLLTYAVKPALFDAVLGTLVNRGFSDSGRLMLWGKAWDAFTSHPVFGSGYYALIHLNRTGVMPSLYHNTVMEMLGACGLVGGVTYLIYRIHTLILMGWRMNGERFFLGLVVVTLLLTSLLDNHVFNIYPMFFYGVALVLVELDFLETKKSVKKKLLKKRLPKNGD